jgi:hypothetical protein
MLRESGSGFRLRWVLIMSLRAVPFPEIPVLTVEVARAAFPGGTLAMRLRDELGGVYESTDFLEAFAYRGAPTTSPGVLALVSVLQYAERLTDRQAADAVRAGSTGSTHSVWS